MGMDIVDGIAGIVGAAVGYGVNFGILHLGEKIAKWASNLLDASTSAIVGKLCAVGLGIGMAAIGYNRITKGEGKKTAWYALAGFGVGLAFEEFTAA